jgi:hypothetical protein
VRPTDKQVVVVSWGNFPASRQLTPLPAIVNAVALVDRVLMQRSVDERAVLLRRDEGVEELLRGYD